MEFSCNDISFGIVLWEIATRRRPYDDFVNIGPMGRWLRMAVQDGLRPDVAAVDAAVCPAAVQALMVRCWDARADARPTAAEACGELRRVVV